MSGKGITCAETFDFDVIEKIYKPYDNLVLGVTLKADGSTDKKVIGSLTEALKARLGRRGTGSAGFPSDAWRHVHPF